jgi:nitrite reductase/ring-hydroxylating ferredoxin subunit
VSEKIALCRLDEIEDGKAKGFEIGDKPIFAVHKDGEYFVYHNKCPHLQIELEWMPDHFLDMDGELIHCSTHGALFLINNGECVSGPCLGERLTVIEHTLENNNLMVAANLALD